MATQIPVGDKFYLFAPSDEVDPEMDHLLISAHGGYNNMKGPLGTSSIAVPDWTQLHFYAAHGNTLCDPTVYGIMKGDYQVKETKGPGAQVTNYGLSKYQGSHGNKKETYDSIKKNVDWTVSDLEAMEIRASLGRAARRNFGFRFCVLTIRNRKFQSSPSLSDALKALETNYPFENIHCSFCRSGIWGKSQSEKAQAYGT